MKQELLTVKELAAALRMSVKSIQRAYRKEEIPVEWRARSARMAGRARRGMVCLVDLVCFVCLVCLVGRTEKRKEQNKPKNPDEQE
jgi:hypothetical protein